MTSTFARKSYDGLSGDEQRGTRLGCAFRCSGYVASSCSTSLCTSSNVNLEGTGLKSTDANWRNGVDGGYAGY